MRRRTEGQSHEEGNNHNVDGNEDEATRNCRDHSNEASQEGIPAPNSDDLITPTECKCGRKRRRDLLTLQEILTSVEDRRAG
jgi:hypothetical protein